MIGSKQTKRVKSQRTLQAIAVCALGVALASCQDPQPSWKALEISIDRKSYTSSDTIIVSLFNPSDATAHIGACGSKVDYDIAPLDSSSSATRYPPGGCGQVSNLRLQTKTGLTDSLPLSLVTIREGRYVLGVYYWLDTGELRNPVSTFSSEFTIVRKH